MEELLIKACSDLNIKLSTKQVEQFILYKNLLLEWNQKINLTTITDERDIVIKHFVDCLTIAYAYNMDSFDKSFVDVGTGAGFPGIPLKILYPDLKLTLIDSLNKRINFLKELVSQLDFNNIELLHSRAEDAGKNKIYRERFDLCASRAVANLSVLSEFCLPFVKVGGNFIALKGLDIEQEVNLAKPAIKILGAKIKTVKSVKLPFSDIEHSIVIVEKLSETPLKYPRKAGMVSKQPLS